MTSFDQTEFKPESLSADKHESGEKSLAQTLWDLIREDSGSVISGVDKVPQRGRDPQALDFSTENLYSSVYDTGTRSMSAEDFSPASDTPPMVPQYRDVINAAPAGPNEQSTDDAVDQALMQVLKQPGDGAILDSAPPAGDGPDRAEIEAAKRANKNLIERVSDVEYDAFKAVSDKDYDKVITHTSHESSDSHIDRLPDRPIFKPGELDLPGERKRLHELVESRISNPQELARFKKDMEAFEARADQRGLSKDEVARTYGKVSRILEAKGEHPLTNKDRVAVAEQVMHQAADPGSIDQGKHVTCNTATIESRIYTQNPSAAAHLVAEVAVNGLFETSRGRLIHPSAESLRADQEAQHNPPLEGKRSYASQIFQVTAINIYHSEATGDQIRYEQRAWGPKPGDSGERLVDVSREPHKELEVFNEKRKAWEPIQTPRVPLDTIPLISEQITGMFEKDMLIVPGPNGDNPNWTKVNSAQELEAKVRELKQSGKLPVVLPVWANNEPFLSDSGGGDPRGLDGQHVITITDYDERTGKIKIDNQFGPVSDRSFTAKELYSRTESAFSDANVQALKEEVERNRAADRIDTAKELDWVRVQAGKGLINGDFYYDEALIRVMRHAEKRWQQQKENGTYNPKEEEHARAKLYSISKDFPFLRQSRVQGRTTFHGGH